MKSFPTLAGGVVPPANLYDLLTEHARLQPERIAIGTSDLKTVITYRGLDDLSQSVVAQLQEFGLKRGDTVALVSDNSLEFVLGLLAIVSLGARVAPLSPALSLPELRTRILQLSAIALLAPRHLTDKLKSAYALLDGTHAWILDVQGTGDSARVSVENVGAPSDDLRTAVQAQAPIESQDVALLMFTRGTTGPPKLVPLTHGNVIASIRNISAGYHLSPEDTTLVVMPLFHGHGLIAGLLSTLASGGTAYLPSTGMFSAHLFWADVVRIGATWYTAAPTVHRILLSRAAKEYPASSGVALRFIRSCSAPLDDELARSVAAAFHAPVISAYDMTEASHQVSSDPLPVNGSGELSAVGLATGVRIRAIGDNDIDVAPGSVGELWIKGPTVTTGYLNDPPANSASFAEGWFRTGDLGSIDADGYIFLRGRVKEMINRAGEKISPCDVDATLLSNPKVLEAASFGEFDDAYADGVEAAVSLHPGMEASEAELREYCRERLSAFEVPERIYIVRNFPRTPKGLIDRQALAALFSDFRSEASSPGRSH
jgi:oxalate---CoA ligase